MQYNTLRELKGTKKGIMVRNGSKISVKGSCGGTHRRVIDIKVKLPENGVIWWPDEDGEAQHGQVLEGIEQLDAIVAFLTASYLTKLNDATQNCFLDIELASTHSIKWFVFVLLDAGCENF